MITLAIVIIIGYILGSLPFAYIVGRLVKGVDIRRVGNRNPGAGNVYREVGAGAGIAVGIADIGKGAVAVLLAKAAGLSEGMAVLPGLAAMVGHDWPIFAGFQGGIGTATALGVLLALLPRETLVLVAIGTITLVLTRSLVLPCALGAGLLPFVSWWLGEPWPLIGGSLSVPAFVGLRLLQRERPRVV